MIDITGLCLSVTSNITQTYIEKDYVIDTGRSSELDFIDKLWPLRWKNKKISIPDEIFLIQTAISILFFRGESLSILRRACNSRFKRRGVFLSQVST